MLDSTGEQAVAGVSEQLQSLLGARLVCVAVYGSGAGADYVPGVSDINVVAVLDELTYEDLRAVRPLVAAWRKRQLATPLLLDRRFLQTAADVFPMELYDIQAQHRVVYGDNVFAALPVNDRNLRYQCEHEARGKLLRLRELYLESGGDRRQLQALMLDSLKTFLIIMRNLNRLHGANPGASYEEVLRTFARHFGCALPLMTRLLQLKVSRAKWTDDVELTFAGYLGELQSVVGVIDEMPPLVAEIS